MLAKCPACKGGKKVMGLGMIYKKCTNCKGSGQVNANIVKEKLAAIPEKLEILPAINQDESKLNIEMPIKKISVEKKFNQPHKGSNANGKKGK